MAFEVPLSSVNRGAGHGRRAVLATLVTLVTVVTLAISSGGVWPARPRVPAAAMTSPRIASPAAVELVVSRVVPADLRCRDVELTMCLRMTRAALRALPRGVPAPVNATVWQSLLCNDNFDCPPTYLGESASLGSVIFAFSDGSPRAAVNVVDGRSGPIRRAPRAWVVRWLSNSG